MDDNEFINDDIEITYEDVIEFEIENQNFVIEYNKVTKEWLCIHNDEELYDYEIVISDDDFSHDDKMILFDNYILTKEYFNELKGFI